MLPLRDHNPSGKFPFINYALILINVAVFVYSLTLTNAGLLDFYSRYSLIPADVTQGQHLLTFITSMFLHGGWMHIIGNMLFLNIFGDNLEDKLGHLGYLLFYLFCGICASLLQVVIDPTSSVPNLGASGAIAGAMGGYLVLFPNHKVDVLWTLGYFIRVVSLPAYFMLFYWIGAQLLYGFGSLSYIGQMSGGVAYFAHIGGFAAGAIIIFLLFKTRRPPPSS